MRKLILLLVALCLPALVWADVTNLVVDTTASSLNGLKRAPHSVAVSSDGDIAVVFGQRVGGNVLPKLAFSTDDGATWAKTAALFSATGISAGALCAFGDSMFTFSTYTTATIQNQLRIANSGTLGILDTVLVSDAVGVLGNIPGLSMISNGGNTRLFGHSWINRAAPNIDSLKSWVVDGPWDPDVVYTSLIAIGFDSTNSNFPSVSNWFYVPYGDGVAMINTNANLRAVYWSDATPVWDTIAVRNITPVIAITQGFGSIIGANDSFFVGAYAPANESLFVRKYHFHEVSDDSRPDSIVVDATVVIETDGVFPGGAGYAVYPSLTHIAGTDSVILYYLDRPNVANVDSINVVLRISTDNGATWGDKTIIRVAVDGLVIRKLTAPPSIPNGSLFPSAYQDSIGTGNVDSVHALLYTIPAAAGPDPLDSCDIAVAQINAVADADSFTVTFYTPLPDADSVIWVIKDSGYQDSTYTDVRYSELYVGDHAISRTVSHTGAGDYTMYMSAWVWSKTDGYSSRCQDDAILSEPGSVVKRVRIRK